MQTCSLFFSLCTIIMGVISIVEGNEQSCSKENREMDEEANTLRSIQTNQTSVPIHELLAGPLLQSDPRLIQYIRDEAERQRFLIPPSDQPYNLEKPNDNPSYGQSQAVLKILRNMRNGFFVECGGLDGEIESNTLDLEKKLWMEGKGLLVEANPFEFDKMLTKGRNAWMSNTCLAIKPYPHQVIFKKFFSMGKTLKDLSDENEQEIESNIQNLRKDQVKAQCFPLYTVLSAMNVSTVDYFSLDVEGLEYAILKTIPFDKILIKVLSVEYHMSKRGEKGIRKLLEPLGYKRAITQTKNRGRRRPNDLILAHKSVEFDKATIPWV